MKNTFLFMACWLVCGTAFGQGPTGINTQNPQQALHISGTPSAAAQIGGTGKYVVTPTLRAEGLNAMNNQAHPADANSPAYSIQPVYATSTGDLVIGRKYTLIEQTLPGASAFPVQELLVPTNTAMVTDTLYTNSFTLAQPSLVYISANVPVTIYNYANVNNQYDGKAKMVGIQFAFSAVPAGSGIPTSYFAASSFAPFFENPQPSAGDAGSGWVLNLGKVIKLPAGAYTFNILGCAGTTGAGPFEADLGDGETDVNITAIPL